MLLSLNWLKDYVNIPKGISPEDLAKKLTLHTVEVEKTENQAERFNNVIVAEILEIKKHPQADRLQIALVNTGKKKLSIVCGAPNIKVGQLVPLAQVGTILTNGMEIKEAEIRGVKSFGMLCAKDELGLGDDHSGIMILDEETEVGMEFAKYINLR
jgi:phenylalanyl-tRNA synthetase beta chain